MLIPEELLAELVARDHDGAGRGNLQQSRHEAGEECSTSLVAHQLPGDGHVTPGPSCSHIIYYLVWKSWDLVLS